MEPYIITTESTVDLPAARLSALGVPVIRMEYSEDGGEPRQDDMSQESAFAVFERMRAGSVVTTALVNTQRFMDFWKPLLEAGSDVLHIAFSSALSSTCQCANMAAEELMRAYPGRSIRVADSRGASGGQGLVVEHAAMQRDAGLSLLACYDWVMENRFSFHYLFTVDDLKYLQRGGRISSAEAFVGSLLRIKPVLDMDLEGRLIPRAKVNGRGASLRNMLQRFEDTFDERLNPFIILCNADCTADAEKMSALIHGVHPSLEIRHSFIGTVIGAHSGPGTLAIFYRGHGRV